MNSFQRVIKYCAIALAVLLAVGIISGIVNIIAAVATGVSGGFAFSHDEDDTYRKTVDFSETYSDVKSLDIENSAGQLTIKKGDAIKVEAENVPESFEAKVSGDGKLKIRENNHTARFLWFNFNDFHNPNARITLYLPENYASEDTKIESGAGKVTIEGLNTGDLLLSAGAGNIDGSDIIADDVKVDGGVGSVNLSNVNFKSSDFDCGVGNLTVDGVLLGKNKIDCGVGEVSLNLTGNVKDYNFDVDSGVGTVRINGEKVSDEQRNNNAPNSIEVDGGVGNVKIDITDSNF